MCCIFKHLSELVRHHALKTQTFKKATPPHSEFHLILMEDQHREAEHMS